MADRLLTVAEAAERLGTGERFIRRLIAERRIRYVKLGRPVRIPESASPRTSTARTVEPSAAPVPATGRQPDGRDASPSGDVNSARSVSSPPAAGRPATSARTVSGTAPETFETKSDAQDWLNLTRADIERNDWRTRTPARSTSRSTPLRWIEERGLAPTTVERYEGCCASTSCPRSAARTWTRSPRPASARGGPSG